MINIPDRYSNLKCPNCNEEIRIKIPNQGVCTKFFMCKKCKKMISAKETCCVICDYGDLKCKPQHKPEKK